ncbi:hypothetical protein K505DRAFT_360851 [Melanomma pulvis-pyrius CBS 109.77]|uniref:Rhodopsin domain-containing protein n=1 Tax=Melanomma pulvis-pyrius CBS 109.77 TaxID=1314802 RepID=A0A6A6XDQ8_9PLEO|nr:hypothetical protein K505DRAFT_360851 [Melanomma pulvis-pyrius CBS 109.77]
MSPPSPWTSNYAAENSSHELSNICISFAVLETLFVMAFVFSWHFNGNNGNNSKTVFFLILVGYLFCSSGVVTAVLMIKIGGAGYHVETVSAGKIRMLLQLIKAQELIYVMSLPLPKLAILCLYYRLFTSKMSYYILYVTGLVIVATCLFGVLAGFFNCRPFDSFWELTVEAHCTMDRMVAFRYYSIPNMVTDVAIILIPVPALWRLKVGVLTKIGVALTFLTCTFGIVTSALRFVAFLDVNVFDDITYLSVSTTRWTIIEPGVYLIAATMPTLRPLIRHLVKKIKDCSPTTRARACCFHQTVPTSYPHSTSTLTEPPRAVVKQSSRQKLAETITIGRRPSRLLPLDDYHYMQDAEIRSLRSMDEESMVCADALRHETMGRQGRNPDGTLRAWSLRPPVQLSPLRTSFFLANP